MGSTKLLVIPIFCLVLLNLILTFTPEIGFDALWYHLTLPKLLLLKYQYYFPGGLLYYSVMPRLTETIFIPLIHLSGTVGPKLLQFISGLGVCYYVFKVSKLFKFTYIYQLAAVSLFYCTWLVSWESSSAYIDLFRTLLEIAALYYFLINKYIYGGVLLGLALGTKWIALFSVFIFSFVFGWQILLPVAIVSSPWFAVSYFYTSNPVYPLFSSILQNGFQSVFGLVKNLLLAPLLFTFPFDDFISPLVGIIFILSVFSIIILRGSGRKLAIVGVLGAISTLILNPPSARFLLPFLPALIISSLLLVQQLPEKINSLLFGLVVTSSFLVLGLRLFAFQKYLPFLVGRQTQNEFLTSMSGRLPSTFIDTDDYVAKNLSSRSSYLIDNLHNLYYFPYNYDHTSWADKEAKYDFLITENQEPSKIAGELIHTNKAGIQIFKLK